MSIIRTKQRSACDEPGRAAEAGASSATAAPATPERLYSIDVLRGFASLAVVLWHWQHFNQADATSFDRTVQPFYPILAIAYTHGHLAVELFFVISGFIFFWLYRLSVYSQSATRLSFFSARFSRLYPLHIATLFIVAALQYLYFVENDRYFIYQNNDLKKFILNILFIHGWGGEGGGFSFNGPSWSVSIEIFLYIMFFICARFGLTLARSVVIICLGAVVAALSFRLGVAIVCFFAGGIGYLIARKLESAPLIIVHISISIAVLCNIEVFMFDPLTSIIIYSSYYIPSIYSKKEIIYNIITLLWVIFTLFLPMVICLATIELKRGPIGKSMAWIGDITYSTYLLHFPLQLFFILILGTFARDIRIIDNNILFLVFFIILTGISLITYHYFERPVQSKIRQALLSNAAT